MTPANRYLLYFWALLLPILLLLHLNSSLEMSRFHSTQDAFFEDQQFLPDSQKIKT